MTSKKAGNPLWGGRFNTDPDDLLTAINASIDIDQRLAYEDIEGSLAHCAMLAAQKIISEADTEKIRTGLQDIKTEISEGNFPFRQEYEDIHMNIEARLTELIGPVAGRLHTARSRNDQVATDFKLWTRRYLQSIIDAIVELQTSLLNKAQDHIETVMPGFTHLQSAQPVSFGHHLLAYIEMLERDRSRFADCHERANQSPLGAAALAGTPYPIDREITASALGFDGGPMRNSLDAISSRDFALEALAAAAICAANLSRFAEEIVIWMTPQFGFISLSDAWTTGSSIMPQKRNPDAAELVRGKVGRIAGDFQSLLMTLKGLSLAYAKDLQEDKEPVFDGLDQLMLCLQAMKGMVSDMQIDQNAMRLAAQYAHPTATDLADWLVREKNMPFRQAHHITAQIVALADKQNLMLWELTVDQMQKIEPTIDPSVKEVLNIDASVAARKSYGGTAPKRVRQQIRFWQEKLV